MKLSTPSRTEPVGEMASVDQVRIGLRSRLEELGAGPQLTALYKQQGKVSDRIQLRVANASYELALEPDTGAEEVRAIFEIIEAGLADPKLEIVESREIYGGVNKTELVTLSNGLRGVWKPNEGAWSSQLRRHVPLGEEDVRDRATYLVDKRLGHFAKVPPTVLRELDGKSGVLTFFVGNSETALAREKPANSHLFQHQCASDSPISLLDNLVGNLDRHQNNWVITRTNRSVPIDHGLTFPIRNGFEGKVNYNFYRPLHIDSASRELLANFLGAREEVSAELVPLVGEDALEAMFIRAESMLESGRTGSDWLKGTYVSKLSASGLGYLKNHSYNIEELPSINSKQAKALRQAGVSDSRSLLQRYSSRYSRQKSAEDLDLTFTQKSLNQVVKMADLMRVEGVGGHYAHLLHEVGVDSVPELGQRNPQTLSQRLKEISETGNSAGQSRVAEWIRKAKLMSRKVSFT